MKTNACILFAAHDLRLETHPVATVGSLDVKVAVLAGGICGTDLHYYHDGGIGPIRVREPIVVGHEAAGRVVEVGDRVCSVAVGDLVAINPSQHCSTCTFCSQGDYVHCLQMRFMGSAYRMPHEQGLFREQLVVPAAQLHRYNNALSPQEAACAEPLAVCLHARSQAPDLKGLRVLVTGAGPIGALCVAAAAQAGATQIVATDLQDYPLSVAKQMGATETINMTNSAQQLERFKADKGQFDVVFECSAAPPAIRDGLMALRPRGTMVMVGVGGDLPVPINLIVSKEINVKGTHRFHHEFADAVKAIDNKKIDVRPIVSQSFKYADIEAAYACAIDRSKAVKVHVLFNEQNS